MQEKIVDLVTGKETFRDYTPEEIAAVEAEKAKAESLLNEQTINIAKKTALFEKLGITEDEAKLLLS